jgi:protease II
MDTLFKTHINVEGKNIAYEVSFHDDHYYFNSLNGEGKNFKIQREEDEWHTKDAIDEMTKSYATDALDKYLLAQH